MFKPRSLLLAAALLASQTAIAVTAAPGDLRQLFAQHYSRAATATQPLDEDSRQALADYPLWPYLEYRLLRNTLEQQDEARVNAFLQQHADTPLYGRLLFAWARQTGERQQWPAFARAWQQIERPNTELQCLHGQYLLSRHQYQAAWQQARTLWSVGHSQPDLCDPLFEAWLKSDNFTSTDALKRYRAALASGREGLAAYARRFISDTSTKAEAERALALYRTPQRLLDEPEQLQPDTPAAATLLEMAVRRLARSDLEAAIRLWLRDRDRLALTPARQARLSRQLGVRLAKRFPAAPEQALLARLDPDYRLEELTAWRIRLALADGDWTQVLQLIERLPANEQASDRWRYWHAIARRGQGQPAATTLDQLARERSFYGFMAAQLIGQPYRLNHQPARFNDDQLAALGRRPAFVRIHELLALEQYSDARSEWNLATAGMSAAQIHQAAHLVSRWGWHHQGIRGAISSGRWHDMDLRFPNPYPELFSRFAGERQIDPAWALAVTRQESAFWMGARSRVGARGLMQLMPATARATARRHGIRLAGLNELRRPEVNIRLGTAYLSEMADRFNGNQTYATAAYNAGPHRVAQWLEARGELPLDVWIETIPYDETRQYVQNVLSFRVIYERLAGRSVALFSEREFDRLALNLAR